MPFPILMKICSKSIAIPLAWLKVYIFRPPACSFSKGNPLNRNTLLWKRYMDILQVKILRYIIPSISVHKEVCMPSMWIYFAWNMIKYICQIIFIYKLCTIKWEVFYENMVRWKTNLWRRDGLGCFCPTPEKTRL